MIDPSVFQAGRMAAAATMISLGWTRLDASCVFEVYQAQSQLKHGVFSLHKLAIMSGWPVAAVIVA